MKRSFLLILSIFFLMTSVCFSQQDASGGLNEEIKALLSRHDKAFGEQNVEGVMEAYASSPDLVLMGTGPGEFYVGKEGVEAAYRQFFTRFEPGSVRFEHVWVGACASGDTAWFGATTKATFATKEEQKEVGFNFSGTVKKEGEHWRLVLLHFSRLGVEEQAENP